MSNSVETKVGDVTCLILVTGQAVLGRVDSRDDKGVSILNAVQFMVQMNGNQIGVDFALYAPILCVYNPEKPLLFKHAHIMQEMTPGRPLADKYIEATSKVKIASGADMAAMEAARAAQGGGKPNIPGFEVHKR